MNCDQRYPFPQVFLVDGGQGQQHPNQPPNLVPCWSFPPAQERVRSRGKSRGCMGVSTSASLIVLMLFLLVFVALGFEAYKIYDMQQEIEDIREVKPETVSEYKAAQKQIGYDERALSGKDKDDRPAAHVMGRIESTKLSNTLRWEPRVARAFTSGGVVYRSEDGALQVNKTGLYHIYSRVEMVFKHCSPASSFIHTMFVRRAGGHLSITLMEAHREGFCPQQQAHSRKTESYLGSALQLQEQDRVYVNVSVPNNLSHGHYGNFFGLYKV